ncbi:Bifunctional ribokinase/ribose-5-phosphate isomerase A [bioreactor metagenome]|uniref:Ribokinase n=1 Tax=bioreactor metagenome TaxID=1076179 RepID=A0A644WJT8_9ZZZZ
MNECTKVIVFNSHGVGMYVTLPRLPNEGETLRGRNWRMEDDGGKGSNFAVALGRLKVSTAFVCRVGGDLFARMGRDWMTAAGIDLSHYEMSPEIHTGVGLVMLLPNGSNTILCSERRKCPMAAYEVAAAFHDYPNAKYFVTGFEIGVDDPLEAARLAKERGLTVLLNPSPLPDYELAPMPFVDYLFINEVEARGLLGGEYEDAANRVRQKYEVGAVILTLGAEGSVLCDKTGTSKFDAPKVEAVNTTGAGDGYMAAFTACLVWGNDPDTAARRANVYAAHTVTVDGTISGYPQLGELKF